MRLYDTLGSKSREAVRNSPRLLHIRAVLGAFMAKRDPIEHDGDFFPRPAYNSPEGDEEFAAWIDKVVREATKLTIAQCVLESPRKRRP